MSCPETLRTQAWLDGELNDKAAAEAEQHARICTECRMLSEDAARLSDAIRLEATRHRAPEELRARVAAAIATEPPRRTDRRSFWLGASSGAAAAALAAGLGFLAILPPSPASLAQAITDAHTRALMSGKTIQIASSNHHTVKPWFAGRVAVSPPVADFPRQGFDLVGGRVDKVAGMQAAVVVYRHDKHEIDLFVWPDRDTRLPGETMRHGYHAIFWKRNDLNFAAVCDMEGPELSKFVRLVRSEPE